MTPDERDRIWTMRTNLQSAFARLSVENKLANGGTSSTSAADIISTEGDEIADHKLRSEWRAGIYQISESVEKLNFHELAHGQYRVHFRLPRFNGKVQIPMGLAPSDAILRAEQLPPLIGALRGLVGKAAAQLRGRAILELVEQEWEIPDQEQTHSKVELGQRLEAAALKMMAAADQELK